MPHTAGLLTFCLRPNPRGPVPSHGDSDAEFVVYTFLPELGGMPAVGFRWLRRLSPCTPWAALSVRSSWLTLQKATSFG